MLNPLELRKLKVKVFEEASAQDLEDALNTWLAGRVTKTLAGGQTVVDPDANHNAEARGLQIDYFIDGSTYAAVVTYAGT